MGFEQELKIITRAYNQAQQGLQDTSRAIDTVAKAATGATEASGKLNMAFATAQKQVELYRHTASGLSTPLEQAAKAEQKLGQEAKKAGSEVQQSAEGLKGHEQGARGASDAVEDFYQTLGALGVVRGFQVAIQGIVAQTREFERTAKQASIVSEDYAGTLERQAMAATQGIYGPTELATVYREVGAAGLAANEVLAASPEILDFATAAMIDQTDAAQAVIAAASSFKIPFTEADRITNAFAEAMNRTTLGGRDLTYALASIGPVAGMANQGLGQTLAAVAALRNAGAQAQDAATSVRAAMLHLSAPSKEAAEMMEQLGIKVFDAQGRMKQWSEIVAEFERALTPYNQQARQMALTTILGSDGIRAMAASMQYGSDRLSELSGQFENAEGSADRMASAMEETLDGAIRRVDGNLQRASITLGSDLQPAIVSVIGFIDKLVVGFINLDDGTRRLVSQILGGAGLVIALGSVARVVQLLSPGFSGLFGWLSKIGPVMTTVTIGAKTMALSLGSVLGILGLVAAAVGLAYGAWQSYKEGQTQATIASGEHAGQLKAQADRVHELTGELESLARKTSPTADEQDRLKQITGELSKLAPEAAGGINQMTGEVTNLGAVLEGTTSAMSRLMAQSRVLAQGAAAAAQAQLPGLKGQQTSLEAQVESWTDAVNQGEASIRSKLRAEGGESQYWVDFLHPSSKEIIDEGTNKLTKYVNDLTEVNGKIAALEGNVQAARALEGSALIDDGRADLLAEKAWRRQYPNGLPTENDGTGGLGLGGGGGGGSSSTSHPSWISQWKDGLQATLAVLDPFQQVLSKVGGELDVIGAKQAYYVDMLDDGKAGVEAVTGVENARVETIAKLKSRQDELHKANEAYRAMLPTLEAKQRDLDSLLATGAITSKDYTDASDALRTETERLTSAIYQNSAAWWKDEQSIAQAEAAAGKAAETLAEARRAAADETYQLTTATMRHEVAMRRLSVDQQITLVRQMMTELSLTDDQRWALQEQLIGLYGQKIEKEADRIQVAYQDAMDAVADDLEQSLAGIDQRLKDTIGPLKAELKDLEGEKQDTDRDRTREEHERELAELQKQRRYHELRVGREHQDALQRIDQEMADETQRWQEQQDDWALDDRKQSIQDQIDEAEEGAKTEREQAQADAKQRREDLDEHYKQVKKIAEDGIWEAISALAATDQQWYSTGQTLIDQLITGLESGDFSTVLAQIESVRSAAEATAETAENSVVTSRQALINQLNDQVDQVHSAWWSVSSEAERDALHDQAERLREQIRSLGGDVRTPAFATGAWEIPYDDMPARLHKGETVLPAYAAETFRSFAPTLTNLPAAIEAAAQQVVQALMSRPAGDIRVYGAENAYLEDSVDVEMIGRQAAREVNRLMPIGG